MFHRDAVADVKASAWALEYANMRTLDLVRCEECGAVLQLSASPQRCKAFGFHQSDDNSRLVWYIGQTLQGR